MYTLVTPIAIGVKYHNALCKKTLEILLLNYLSLTFDYAKISALITMTVTLFIEKYIFFLYDSIMKASVPFYPPY